MRKKDKSILRTKESTAKISEFLAREGAATLMPGGGLFYDSVKALFQHGKQYFKDRTEVRLDQFHQALITGDFNNKEYEQFLDKEFDLNDYYTILSSCVQDIEDEKIAIYSQLMQSLILKTLDSNIRRHFITSTKSMTFQDILFLKELYINSKFDLMTVGGTSEQVKKLLFPKDVFKDLTIERMISNGFIHKNRSGLTPIGEHYAESIFSSSELKPNSIGRKPWTGINIVIVSYQLGDPQHIIVVNALQEALWKINVKSSIHILRQRPTSSMFYGAAFLLVGEKTIEDKYINALALFSGKKPMIRLNLNEICSEIDLNEIKFSKTLTLRSTTPVEIRSEVNDIVSRIFSQDI